MGKLQKRGSLQNNIMKKVRIILNVFIVLLIILQFFGYIGNMHKEAEKSTGAGLLAYYIGFNLPFILAFILFLISRNIKRKIKKNESNKIIDSIGKI
jgi:TRAP-type C4-dicarboxylate transport system permease small subunit